MARFDIFDTIDRLRRGGAPFAVATVLRTADATSAKAGAKAAITAEGEILGHLGGACVARAVRTAAAEALESGAPRMIRVKPADAPEPEGMQSYRSGCPSGGTVDLLIEPYLHPPRLVVFGRTPIARAIAAHGALAGFRVFATEPAEGVAAVEPDALGALGVEPRDFVVVASQGDGDLACLKAALESPAERVSMVASRRKAEVLKGRLAAQGVDAARLKSPAGLDIGAVDPHEIALSVLAEIVFWRAARSDGAAAPRERSA